MLFATLTTAPSDPYAALYAALASALATVIIWAVTQLARRFGVQFSAERHAQLEAVVENAILLMEERGRNQLKAGLEALTPADKLRGAIAFVSAKLPAVRAAIIPFATAAIKKATRTKGGRK